MFLIGPAILPREARCDQAREEQPSVRLRVSVLILSRALRFLRRSKNQHRVPVAIKTIPPLDSLAVRREDPLLPGERGDEH